MREVPSVLYTDKSGDGGLLLTTSDYAARSLQEAGIQVGSKQLLREVPRRSVYVAPLQRDQTGYAWTHTDKFSLQRKYRDIDDVQERYTDYANTACAILAEGTGPEAFWAYWTRYAEPVLETIAQELDGPAPDTSKDMLYGSSREYGAEPARKDYPELLELSMYCLTTKGDNLDVERYHEEFLQSVESGEAAGPMPAYFLTLIGARATGNHPEVLQEVSKIEEHLFE